MPTANRQALKQQFLDQAVQIFTTNLQQGFSQWKNQPYRYIAPANTEYIYQWQWDTAFHAIVLSHIDPSWARAEIASYLQGQWADGFLPHVIFWPEQRILPHWAYIESNPWARKIHTTAITQPPVTAIAVERIEQVEHNQVFLDQALPALARHHRWLKANRDPDNDDLLSIISPNESGMDELPVFQEVVGFTSTDTARLHYYYRKADLLNQVFRYNNRRILQHDHFNVEELVFNTIFVEASRSLGRLFAKVGNATESEYFLSQSDKTEKAIIDKCWSVNEHIFYSLYGRQELPAQVKTVASIIPLFLTKLPQEQVDGLVQHLLNPQEFWIEYPVPSVAKSSKYYQPHDTPAYQVKLLWRGPTWVNTNWLIVKGLRSHGRHDIADQIVDKMIHMITKEGFREYYNPETGEGYRRRNFGWSTLIADLLD